ncbi:MAG: galactose-1-phosphate uridylyltransferase [Polyangiales bacterium]
MEPTALHRRSLTKPDGRGLWLYGRAPLDEVDAVEPAGDRPAPNPHLRWHPLRGEWVAYAGHRQARTFQPPADYNPLAPTRDPAHPTEVPAGNWEVAVFENRFPTLFAGAHDPPAELVGTLPARGSCEVVVFTQDPSASLGSLPVERVALVVSVWADRHRSLAARGDVLYVFPFENRGAAIGATLPHPHGQIYAFPFVPPVAARELALQREHHARCGRGLLADLLDAERRDGRRVVFERGGAVSVVPVCARYAYELWVAPLRPVPTFADLSVAEVDDFAAALKDALQRLDALWRKPMPYVLVFHQAPTDGRAHPEAHLHAEIYPALRMPDRLKYLAGCELGAGSFTADTIPEEKAAELRALQVSP